MHRSILLALAIATLAACAGARPTPDASAPAPVRMPTVRGPGELPTGTRIRYLARNDWRGLRTDRVARATGDTLWLASGHAVPVATLRRLDVSRENGPSENRRMAWGAAVGGSLGALLGALLNVEGGSPDGEALPPADAATLVGTAGLLFGMLGAVWLWPGEQWEPVALPLPAR